MPDRFSRELQAFQALARAVSEGPDDPEAILELLRSTVREGFGFARVGVVCPDELAAGHPLVRRALDEGRAVTEGSRVAVPIADGECHGVLIGDADGGPLDLGAAELGLLAALATVAAVFVAKAGEHGRRLEARTSFVSLASHELRTPIAVVHGIVATLHQRGERLPAERRRELRATAFEHTTRLALLTEQLLDLSRLEAGALAATPRRFRPRALVEDLLERVAPDRRADVELELDPDLELEADPDALERILSNLIVNALRHGLPPVCVRAETGARPRLVVEDVGAGIEPELGPRLFERFARGGRGRGLGPRPLDRAGLRGRARRAAPSRARGAARRALRPDAAADRRS